MIQLLPNAGQPTHEDIERIVRDRLKASGTIVDEEEWDILSQACAFVRPVIAGGEGVTVYDHIPVYLAINRSTGRMEIFSYVVIHRLFKESIDSADSHLQDLS